MTVTNAELPLGSTTLIPVCPAVVPAFTVNEVPLPLTVAIDVSSDVGVNELTPVYVAVNDWDGCGATPANVIVVGLTVNCGIGVGVGDGVAEAENVGIGVNVGP